MDLSPAAVLGRVAEAIPEDLRSNITIIGSLAAGYQLFGSISSHFVRTKDIDCVLVPRSAAVHVGQSVAGRLIAEGWSHRSDGEHTVPGTGTTPPEELPTIRLVPPGQDGWFLELLTVPDPSSANSRTWTRVELSNGHYGLPSFRFLPITVFLPNATEFGVYCARPEMMALANLLEHPVIGDARMSGLIAGRSIKRSNKDLGRAIAIARLSEDMLDQWPDAWLDALRQSFPDGYEDLVLRAGQGLRALLDSGYDLDEAWITCNNGLLANANLTRDEFVSSAERLLVFAVEALERRTSV